jgi:hypothetical protein
MNGGAERLNTITDAGFGAPIRTHERPEYDTWDWWEGASVMMFA